MNRKIQPAVQRLEEIHIMTPERLMLPDGIPLAVIRAGEQEVVRLDILFHSGRWHQSQKLEALFTARMLQEGTRAHEASFLAERLDGLGSWLSSYCTSTFSGLTIYSLNKHLAETLDLVNEMIREPLFSQDRLDRVTEVNMQQFRVNMSKVDLPAQRVLMRGLYGENHPCGQWVEEEDYRALTPQLLRGFHEKHFRSKNCSVYVSGKVTDEVLKELERIFTSPFGDERISLALPDYPLSTTTEKRFFVSRDTALQSAVKLGCLTLERTHPDYLKLKVLVTALGGYFGSRLMSTIREEKGYTYGIGAGISHYPDGGFLCISTETDNIYVEPLIEQVYREIERLQCESISKKELSVVRNYMLGEMCRGYESAFSLSDAWIAVDTAGLGGDYFARSLHAINETSAEELRLMAQKYLCKENLKEAVVGKKLS